MSDCSTANLVSVIAVSASVLSAFTASISAYFALYNKNNSQCRYPRKRGKNNDLISLSKSSINKHYFLIKTR
jgi:hypothetical protein